jgi:nucleotide-binding universal stress UspA family protein
MPMRGIVSLVAALDGSPASGRALVLAGQLACTFQAKVTVLHVIAGVPHAVAELRENLVAPELRAYADLEHRAVNDAMWALGEELAGQGVRRLREMGVGEVGVAIEVGDAAVRIVDFARHNEVTQIILGRRGLSGIERILLGSVCDKVVRLAPCACIAVP